MTKRLIITDGKHERVLTLVEKMVVGRDPTCDVTHEDDLLSSRHAEFIADGDSVTVRDLGGRNGILVNGLRTTERELYTGDVVQVGPLRMLYAPDHSRASLEEHVRAERAIALPPPPNPAVPVRDAPPNHPGEWTIPPVFRAQPTLTPAPPAVSAIDLFPTQEEPTQVVAPPPASLAAPNQSPITPLQRPWQSPTPAAAEESPAVPTVQPTEPVPDFSASATVSPQATVDHPSSRAVDADIATYVLAQSTVLAAFVVLSAILPLWLWRREALGAWLAIPIAAAIAATYSVSRLISGRFLRIVKALKPDVHRFDGIAGSLQESPRIPERLNQDRTRAQIADC